MKTNLVLSGLIVVVTCLCLLGVVTMMTWMLANAPGLVSPKVLLTMLLTVPELGLVKDSTALVRTLWLTVPLMPRPRVLNRCRSLVVLLVVGLIVGTKQSKGWWKWCGLTRGVSLRCTQVP